MQPVELKNKNGVVTIGDNFPILVNCNIGINHKDDRLKEFNKIDILLKSEEYRPDIMMDLSICKNTPSIAKHIIDTYNIPVGIVPCYSIFSPKNGLSKKELIDNIIENGENGIAFMTMHFTSDRDIYQIAKNNRKIPITSRGGSIVLSDMLINKKEKNIYIENIDEIIGLSIKYNFIISLGTTFRPAGIVDACDEAHVMETSRQIELCRYIHEHGGKVIVENVGHINIEKIKIHSKMLREMNAPIMPLGPIPIDNAIGYDHIAAAIGAAFMGYYSCAHIINAISPSEHLTSTFSIEDMKHAIVAAKIAASSINVNKFAEYQNANKYIYNERANKKSCLITTEENCSRCDTLCPLKM